MAPGAGDRETLGKAAEGSLRFEGDSHAWVAVGAVEAWLGQDAQSQASLQAMIAKAAPFGWIAEDGRSIRAHVEWL